ncbi:MAG: (1--_2) glucan export composite transrane/ATP-binding protein [Candidatus Saccharibacteria bacterium]|nr:(1-->2) glucan export composite transrane/ATP-binding protein [Candidatus Saccharibacteria bacterium]
MKHLLRILKSAKELRRYYIAISIFTVLLALMSVLQPLVTGWAIDELRKGTAASLRFVLLLALAIFILDVLATLFSNIGGYFGDQMSLRLNRILSRRYYEHLLTLPQSYYDTELSGKIISRLNRSINQITNFMQMMSNNFLQFLFSTIFILSIVAYYSWPTALMMFLLYPVYIFFTVRTSKKWRDWQTEKNKNFDIANGRFGEVINQVKVVKSFLSEKREVGYFDKHYGRAQAINEPQSKYWHTHDVTRRLVLNVIFFGVYAYIFWQGAQGHLTPGAVVALILYSTQIRIPIFTISMLVDTAQRAIADTKDYFEVMNLSPEIADKPGAKAIEVREGEVVFKKVCFGYTKDKDVLKDIDLHIAAHTKVALVGESGEGKTTLTNLIMRLYEPTKGHIFIDGQNITEVTQASLREQIGVVFQEPALFSGTIRENIAYGRPDAPSEDIELAARAANAHTFIDKLEKKYDTPIGERGMKLSGGQKQRIAIARAILKDAPILILDEATSSLDSRSEQLVQEALERLMQNRTTIIIAHRLSTIQHVDQIVTIRNGQIDECGSPHELERTGGIYAQLLELQQRSADQIKEEKLKQFDIADD